MDGVILGLNYSLGDIDSTNRKFPVYETETHIAYLIDEIDEARQQVKCYGVFNKKTGLREAETRREDVLIAFMDALVESVKKIHQPMADEVLKELEPFNGRAA